MLFVHRQHLMPQLNFFIVILLLLNLELLHDVYSSKGCVRSQNTLSLHRTMWHKRVCRHLFFFCLCVMVLTMMCSRILQCTLVSLQEAFAVFSHVPNLLNLWQILLDSRGDCFTGLSSNMVACKWQLLFSVTVLVRIFFFFAISCHHCEGPTQNCTQFESIASA